MAAPLGFKTFNSGDVLTAADTNGYLMQGVWTFANAAARTAAVTSPQEGNVSFLKDTNSLEIYDGAAWVAYGSGDITGVTAGTGISGGGTSGAVTITNDMATKIDAKGDLVVGTGADTYDRLAVGTNGQALLADSTTATGLKWGSVSASKSFSLLGTGTLTGAATITVSGISGIDDIYVIVKGASGVSANAVGVRINTDTGSNYYRYGTELTFSSAYSSANFSADGYANTYWNIGFPGSASAVIHGYAVIRGCNTSGKKMIFSAGNGTAGGGNGQTAYILGGYYDSASTVSSVSLFCSGSNFDAGTFEIYGAA